VPYAGLFEWWIATITWSIAFPIAISIYLYMRRPSRKVEEHQSMRRLLADFTFVWFLLGLLVFYIVAVGEGSPVLFAFGNVVVEALLVIYVLRARR